MQNVGYDRARQMIRSALYHDAFPADSSAWGRSSVDSMREEVETWRAVVAGTQSPQPIGPDEMTPDDQREWARLRIDVLEATIRQHEFENALLAEVLRQAVASGDYEGPILPVTPETRRLIVRELEDFYIDLEDPLEFIDVERVSDWTLLEESSRVRAAAVVASKK